MKNLKIAFLMTNFNNSKDTIECINSIFKIHSIVSPIIIVIDNNSNVEQIKILEDFKSDFPEITILLNKINSGYFNGLNFGLEYLSTNSIFVNFVVIGNNDLIFSHNFLEMIYKQKQTLEQFIVISPNIITQSGIHQNPHIIKGISRLRGIIYSIYYSNYYVAKILTKVNTLIKPVYRRLDSKQYQISRTIFAGHGSCYILTKKFFNCFGQLYSPSFLMHEEYFLSFQLFTINASIYYESSIKVIHKNNSTTSKIQKKSLWRISKKSYQLLLKHLPLHNWYI